LLRGDEQICRIFTKGAVAGLSGFVTELVLLTGKKLPHLDCGNVAAVLPQVRNFDIRHARGLFSGKKLAAYKEARVDHI